MGGLPVLKPRQVAALLEALGFAEVRQRGSHTRLMVVHGVGVAVAQELKIVRVDSDFFEEPGI